MAIAQAEETKNAHTYVSELDVLQAKGNSNWRPKVDHKLVLISLIDTYDTCTVLCAWKLENHTDDTLQFIVHDDLDVLLDTNKLKNRDVDAVFIRMLESRDYHYGPFAELVHGLQTTAKGLWTKDKVMWGGVDAGGLCKSTVLNFSMYSRFYKRLLSTGIGYE